MDDKIKIKDLNPIAQNDLKEEAVFPMSQDGETYKSTISQVIQKVSDNQDDKYFKKTEKIPNENLTFGEIKEGDKNVVSGGEVYNYLNITSDNKLKTSYIKKNTSIASNGSVVMNRVGATSIVDFPLEAGVDYYLGGFNGHDSKYMSIVNLSGEVLEVKGTKPTPILIPKSNEKRLLRVNVGFTNETNIDIYSIYINENKNIGAGYVSEVNKTPIKAKSLSNNNIVPTPITRDNAVNKGYFDDNALKDSDLKIKTSSNLFDRTKIVDNKYISNTGSVQSVDGWQFILINVSKIDDLSNITFGRIKPSTPSYWCFYNTDVIEDLNVGNKITNGTFITTENSITVEKPVGAITLGITIKRPTNAETVYKQGTINIGSVLLPYEEYYQVVEKIKDYELQGGGESYNQDLNTFDDVVFNKISTSTIETSILVANLPTSDIDIPLNHAWIDIENNNVIKVKL